MALSIEYQLMMGKARINIPMVKRFLLVACTVAISGCSGVGVGIAEDRDSFRIPKIRVPIVQIHPAEAPHMYGVTDSMDNSHAMFAGKSRFSDFISLSNYCDSLLHRDEVDFSVLEKYKDTMNSDGLQLFVDYNTTVKDTSTPRQDRKLVGNTYYPVFIVNGTSRAKLFNAVSEAVYALQEAKDSNGEWRPIESAPQMSWCGNSYWGLKIYPGEFVTVLLAKHQGDYKTQLRVRMSIGNCLYVSAPFEGTINYKKFYMKWWSEEHGWLTIDEKRALGKYFYGSNVLFDRNSKAQRAYAGLAKDRR